MKFRIFCFATILIVSLTTQAEEATEAEPPMSEVPR